MFLYALGSLLFGFGMVMAVGVIASNLNQYRQQMAAALRTLSLDSVHAQSREPSKTAGLALRKSSARPALRPAA